VCQQEDCCCCCNCCWVWPTHAPETWVQNQHWLLLGGLAEQQLPVRSASTQRAAAAHSAPAAVEAVGPGWIHQMMSHAVAEVQAGLQ